ncbi:MAG: hypothetical protein ACLU38_04215 [Dysosmobacter sp.]
MSDKTTAALAAEQADVEATTTQETELLPAATLDELEQVDLGTVAEGERDPFRITDDRCADSGPSARSPTSAASTTA